MKIKPFFKSLIVPAVLCVGPIAWGQVMLVTEQEALASQAAAPQFTVKAIPDANAPRIILETPDISVHLDSPINIKLSFKSSAPAAIRPETFRVLYGAFGIDVTRRITGAAEVTPLGLEVRQATLPKGSHMLQIELDDSVGRHGQQRFEFKVR